MPQLLAAPAPKKPALSKRPRGEGRLSGTERSASEWFSSVHRYEQPKQQCLLDVQPVLRLIPYERTLPIERGLVDLFTAMSRQTVQHGRPGMGSREQAFIHGPVLQSSDSRGAFRLLPHAGPHVRV